MECCLYESSNTKSRPEVIKIWDTGRWILDTAHRTVDWRAAREENGSRLSGGGPHATRGARARVFPRVTHVLKGTLF